MKWLPLDDLLYKCSRFIEFSDRSKVSFDELTELLTSFPRRFDNYIKDPHQLDDLEEEYQEYETMYDNDMSKEIWEESLVKVSEGRSYYWMDIIWSEIKKSLPKLENIVLFLLTIPHSNAGEERIFSITEKNKTKFLSNLDNETSLNSIMLIKTNTPEPFKSCYQWKFSNEQLKKYKTACKEYNKQHPTS